MQLSKLLRMSTVSEGSLYCSGCGKKVEVISRFCGHCGCAISQAQTGTGQYSFSLDLLLGGFLAAREARATKEFEFWLSVIWVISYVFLILCTLLMWAAFLFGNRWAFEIHLIENESLALVVCGTLGLLFNVPLAGRVFKRGQSKQGVRTFGRYLLGATIFVGTLTWMFDRDILDSIDLAKQKSAQEALYKKLDQIPRGSRFGEGPK